MVLEGLVFDYLKLDLVLVSPNGDPVAASNSADLTGRISCLIP
jgi:hypothetical protein